MLRLKKKRYRDRRTGQIRETKNWYIRGTVAGEPVEESTATHIRERADEYRIRREHEILDRRQLGGRASCTLLEAAVSYLEEGGEGRFVGRLIAHFDETPLDQIDQAIIERCARELYPVGTQATRLRQVFTPMRAILNHAAERKMGPWTRVKAPIVREKPVREVPTGDVAAFLAAADDAVGALARFLFYTGCRLGEALRLGWQDVDLTARRAIIRQTKSGEARGIWLHDEIWQALANATGRSGKVFRRLDGKPWLDRFDVRRAWVRTCDRAGIPRFTRHQARHTWATWMRQTGTDLRDLKDMGGWASERMVMRYSHVNPDYQAEAISRLPKLGNFRETGG